MKTFLEYNGQELVEETEPETMVLPVRIGRSDYLLEVSDTPETIQRGLSGRQSIPRKTGMLFVMPVQSIQEFWMKGCETDMDILFVKEDGMIIHMERMLRERKQTSTESDELYESRLRSYSSKYPAKYAIEIPSGDITRLGLHLGEMINIPENINEQVIPISAAINVANTVKASNNQVAADVQAAQEKDKKEAAKPKTKRKLEMNALKNVTSSDAYRDASEKQRGEMLDRALQGIGDDPEAAADQFTSQTDRDAAYDVAQDTRRSNIDQDIRRQFDQLSDEEKMLSPDELRSRGLIGSRYSDDAPTLSRGRLTDPNNPFGSRRSSPEDMPSGKVGSPRSTGEAPSKLRSDLFRAEDDLAQLKRDIRSRRQARRKDDAIMRIARDDLRILDANKDIKPGDVKSGKVSLGQVGDAIRDAGGYTRGERRSTLRSAGRNSQGFRVAGMTEQYKQDFDHSNTAKVSAENANATNRTPGEIQDLMHKLRDKISGVASKYLKSDKEPPKTTVISPEQLKSTLIAKQALKFDPRGEAETDYTGGVRIRPKETSYYTKLKQRRRSEAEERVRSMVHDKISSENKVRQRVKREIEGERILKAVGKPIPGRDYSSIKPSSKDIEGERLISAIKKLTTGRDFGGIKTPLHSLEEIALMPEDPDKGLSLAKLKSKYVRQAVTRIATLGDVRDVKDFDKTHHGHVNDAHEAFVKAAGKHHGLEADHPHLDHQLFLSQVGMTLQ